MAALQLDVHQQLELRGRIEVGVELEFRLCARAPEVVQREHDLLSAEDFHSVGRMEGDPRPLLAAHLEAVAHGDAEPAVLAMLEVGIALKVHQHLEGRILLAQDVAAQARQLAHRQMMILAGAVHAGLIVHLVQAVQLVRAADGVAVGIEHVAQLRAQEARGHAHHALGQLRAGLRHPDAAPGLVDAHGDDLVAQRGLPLLGDALRAVDFGGLVNVVANVEHARVVQQHAVARPLPDIDKAQAAQRQAGIRQPRAAQPAHAQRAQEGVQIAAVGLEEFGEHLTDDGIAL